MPYLVYSSRQQQPWAEVTDRELMIGIRSGDESAFDELIRRKTGPLIQLVTRILPDREEARDIVQIVFLRVWEKRQRFDERWSPNTWLYRIAVNLAIDQLRARKVRDRSSRPLSTHLRGLSGGHGRGLAELEHREVAAIFERLAVGLTEKQRLAFLLVAVEGLSSEEAGQILACKASTVRNHLFAARRFLRRELSRLYPEYLPGRSDPRS